MVIFRICGHLKVTTKENFSKLFMDASKIWDFANFNTIDAIKQYLIKYFNVSPNDIVVEI